ncbi:MAG: hypothetical protein P4N60_14220, partial [Verrucomicrobiae bacterium]|nr:hypothetical protein [Verrucomicrobiae bacterium]
TSHFFDMRWTIYDGEAAGLAGMADFGCKRKRCRGCRLATAVHDASGLCRIVRVTRASRNGRATSPDMPSIQPRIFNRKPCEPCKKPMTEICKKANENAKIKPN